MSGSKTPACLSAGYAQFNRNSDQINADFSRVARFSTTGQDSGYGVARNFVGVRLSSRGCGH